MNFEAPHEIRELQASLAKLLADQYGREQRRAIAAGDDGFSREVWRQMASMGLTALTLPAEHGGFGFAPADLLPVYEELGRALVLEPVLASSVLAATALRRAATPAVQAQLLPGVADGSTILALAHGEPGARHDPWWVRTAARESGDGWLLSGTKNQVLHGAAADVLLVSAQLPGASPVPALFRVDANAAGLQRRAYRLIDDSPAAEVQFADTPATLLAQGSDAVAAVLAAREAGIAALVAEAVGVARGALALTTEYVNVRQQFGRTLAANQVVRHRVAEMAVMFETLRSAAMAALCALGRGDAAARDDIVRGKMLAGRHGVLLAEQAVQLHGGYGMTTEYGVGNYLRRMTAIDLLLGDAAHHAAAHGAALAAAA